eukprot:6672629-Lingulodinium_polyedra.AAC.1
MQRAARATGACAVWTPGSRNPLMVGPAATNGAALCNAPRATKLARAVRRAAGQSHGRVAT